VPLDKPGFPDFSYCPRFALPDSLKRQRRFAVARKEHGMGVRDVPKEAEAILDGSDESFDAEEEAVVSFANGFMTAAIVSPKLIDPSEWLPDLMETSAKELKDEELEAVREVLMIGYRDILNSLAARDGSYSPYFWEDEEGRPMTRDWAEGFLVGMDLSKAAWDRVLEDNDRNVGFYPIFALLQDEKILADIEKAGGLSREEILLAAQAELPLVLEEFFELSAHGSQCQEAALKEPVKRVGRNDPCPCGSGKKYKKCCLN
jgi:uncharacterized protein